MLKSAIAFGSLTLKNLVVSERLVNVCGQVSYTNPLGTINTITREQTEEETALYVNVERQILLKEKIYEKFKNIDESEDSDEVLDNFDDKEQDSSVLTYSTISDKNGYFCVKAEPGHDYTVETADFAFEELAMGLK